MIAALLLTLSLHHHGIPLASRQTCYRLHRHQHCIKTPMWSATHAAVGTWTRHERRWIHHKWRRVTVTFPVLRERSPRLVSHGSFLVTGYSWGCGTPNGITASGTVPRLGTISNDFLPFGTVVDVPALHYRGIVLDRGVGTGGFDLFVSGCTGFPTGYYRVFWR